MVRFIGWLCRRAIHARLLPDPLLSRVFGHMVRDPQFSQVGSGLFGGSPQRLLFGEMSGLSPLGRKVRGTLFRFSRSESFSFQNSLPVSFLRGQPFGFILRCTLSGSFRFQARRGFGRLLCFQLCGQLSPTPSGVLSLPLFFLPCSFNPRFLFAMPCGLLGGPLGNLLGSKLRRLPDRGRVPLGQFDEAVGIQLGLESGPFCGAHFCFVSGLFVNGLLGSDHGRMGFFVSFQRSNHTKQERLHNRMFQRWMLGSRMLGLDL